MILRLNHKLPQHPPRLRCRQRAAEFSYARYFTDVLYHIVEAKAFLSSNILGRLIPVRVYAFLPNKAIFDASVTSSLTPRFWNEEAVFAAFSDFWRLHHFSACAAAEVRAGRVGKLFGPLLRDER